MTGAVVAGEGGERGGGRRPRRLRDAPLFVWLLWTAALALFVAVMAPHRTTVAEVHIVLPMLLLVLVASSFGGERLGIFLAALGFVAIHIVFQRPYGSLSLSKPHDITVMVAFFVTAAVSTRLLARARYEADLARRRGAEVQRMADLGAEMLSAVSPSAALERVAAATCELLGAERCRIDRGSGDGEGEEVALVTMRAPAALVDPATRELQSLAFPLHADGGRIGELRVEGVDHRALAGTQAATLRALAQYAALGLDRMRLAADAAHAEALREGARMKDMVLASVSHDLRTPLTTIKILAASLARRGDAGARQIEEEADRLSRMVADLLDLSRARAGALTLTMDLNTLEDLVGAAMRQLAPVLGERRVRRSVFDEEGPLVGRFDFVASMRVLVNLLENAAKYSPSHVPIDLVAHRLGGALLLEVRDRGAGVAEEDLERIFLPFFRSQKVLYDVGGAGLGLAMARTLAEAQGGSVTYARRDGGGSVFTFALPALDQPISMVLEESEAPAH